MKSKSPIFIKKSSVQLKKNHAICSAMKVINLEIKKERKFEF